MHRDEWKKQIKRDFPLVLDEHVDLVLDLWEQKPEFIQQLIKEEKQRTGLKRPPEPKKQLTVDEFVKLNSKTTVEVEEDVVTPSEQSS